MKILALNPLKYISSNFSKKELCVKVLVVTTAAVKMIELLVFNKAMYTSIHGLLTPSIYYQYAHTVCSSWAFDYVVGFESWGRLAVFWKLCT
jgi:hypothetical protein